MNSSTVQYEEDINDQPVDYSKQYIERNPSRKNNLLENIETKKEEFPEHDSKVNLFGDYAETDLDQPTDYSLRYAEDDTDEDEKQNAEYFPGSEQEDTVKTYCTEGTPYETPFNFSTATSMSDLRLEDCKDGDLSKRNLKKVMDMTNKESLKARAFSRTNEQVPKENKEEKSVPMLSSGCVTPEKLVTYCEEGTPGFFSRVSSLSSLNSGIISQNNRSAAIAKDVPLLSNQLEPKVISCNTRIVTRDSTIETVERENVSEGKTNVRTADKEGKVVTFGGEDFYAEQTPLMFSRCSSLGSLSGFEQCSIHDDRSSIVSDFSRRTSGVVSPSELPDSPTQTVPPSPRHHKPQSADFITRVQEETMRSIGRNILYSKPPVLKQSVFEDDLAAFKEESTPIEFSAATSLSSLIIDDEPTVTDKPKPKEEVKEEVTNNVESGKISLSHQLKLDEIVENEKEQVSDCDDDDDILAACINIGMQNNRYRQSFKKGILQKPVHPPPLSNLVRYQTISTLNRLEPRIPVGPGKPLSPTPKTKSTVDVAVVPDTVHIYCTEDTPADISPVGSQSNLSALSMPSITDEKHESKTKFEIGEIQRNELSDGSSNISADDEKILDECIQSGIPKIRHTPTTKPPPLKGISISKQPETSSQKFNICGTPSTSPVESSSKSAIIHKSLPIKNGNATPLSDDSPNHSDDEAILKECIESAMSKPRLSTTCSSMTTMIKREVDLPNRINHHNQSTSASVFRKDFADSPTPSRPTVKTDTSENNLRLSEEEEEIILAQCIQSGIPKVLNNPSLLTLPVLTKTEVHSKNSTFSCILSSSTVNGNYSQPDKNIALHQQLLHKSQKNNIASVSTAETTCDLALITDLKNLQLESIDNCSSGQSPLNTPYDSTDILDDKNSNLNTLYVENQNCDMKKFYVASNLRTVNYNDDNNEFGDTEDNVDEFCRRVDKCVAPSGQNSVSSISEEDSLGSMEEWEMLELCINSAMPRRKYSDVPQSLDKSIGERRGDTDTIPEDNYSVCSYNSYVCKT